MRNLLALLGAAVLTFVGLGWYLGWYTFAPAASSTPDHPSVTIDINAKQIDADLHRGEKRVQEALDHAAHAAETAKQATGASSSSSK